MGAAEPTWTGTLVMLASAFVFLLIVGWAFFPHWREQ